MSPISLQKGYKHLSHHSLAEYLFPYNLANTAIVCLFLVAFQLLSHVRLFATPPGSSVLGILQARILDWVAIPLSRDLPNPGSEPFAGILHCRQILYPLSYQGNPVCLFSPCQIWYENAILSFSLASL